MDRAPNSFCRYSASVRRCLTTLACAAALVAVGRTPASANTKEYEVKAAFLFNFAQYVDWPGSAFSSDSAPIVIGIVGKDSFGSIIDQTVKGKIVKGRSFVVKRLSWGQAVKDCHILFVSASEKDKLGQMNDLLKGEPVLTVGETSGFAKRDGIVNFIIEGNKVRFEINPEAAKRAKLSISSRLLSLAKIVSD
jgi:hypothetical protein